MKKFLYVLPIMIITALASNAYVDTDHMTTEHFLINNGYSKDTAAVVESQKRDPYGPVNYKKDKRNIWMKIYNYIDPVSGGNRTYPVHDVKIDSNWQDL